VFSTKLTPSRRGKPPSGRELRKEGESARAVAAFEHPAEQIHVFFDARITLAKLVDLADCMDDGGGVAATEFPAYFRQGAGGELLGKIHCNLAGASCEVRR